MSANRPVTVYVSAAPDLVAERDAIGRIIAKLPVTVIWHVVQTPTSREPLDRKALQEADLHLLVMGSDIRAPIGHELRAIRAAAQRTTAFLKGDVGRTPAGREFIKDAQLSWRRYAETADLTRQVRRIVANHVLRRAQEYELTPTEVERLKGLLKEDTPEESPEGEGADRSAVILSRERFEPRQGIALDDESKNSP